jgi:hypothetical protein
MHTYVAVKSSGVRAPTQLIALMHACCNENSCYNVTMCKLQPSTALQYTLLLGVSCYACDGWQLLCVLALAKQSARSVPDAENSVAQQ